MAAAHLAGAEYKARLPELKQETDTAVTTMPPGPGSFQPEEIKHLACLARERGDVLRAGYQLLCVVEVVLQSLAAKESAGAALAAFPAGSATHTKSMRGRKRRLGDLLPLSVLDIRDGPALRNRLESVLHVQPRYFHNKLQELGLCPPGQPADWGRGDGSAWSRAWAGRGRLVLLQSEP